MEAACEHQSLSRLEVLFFLSVLLVQGGSLSLVLVVPLFVQGGVVSPPTLTWISHTVPEAPFASSHEVLRGGCCGRVLAAGP